MAKKKTTTGKKAVQTPAKLKTALSHLGLRLPHGYELTKRKTKKK